MTRIVREDFMINVTDWEEMTGININDVCKKDPGPILGSAEDDLAGYLKKQSKNLLRETERHKQEIYEVLDKYVTNVA